eukprot:859970-Rhodomonas_salina.2
MVQSMAAPPSPATPAPDASAADPGPRSLGGVPAEADGASPCLAPDPLASSPASLRHTSWRSGPEQASEPVMTSQRPRQPEPRPPPHPAPDQRLGLGGSGLPQGATAQARPPSAGAPAPRAAEPDQRARGLAGGGRQRQRDEGEWRAMSALHYAPAPGTHII